MGPDWQKLASLAQETCTLWFQFFGAVFASKGYLLKNIFHNLTIEDHFLLQRIKINKWTQVMYLVYGPKPYLIH